MTEGTSQGLFIVVAIVIFGIFVSLSYTLFGKTLQPQMVGIFEEGIETVGIKKELPKYDDVNVVPTNEDLFEFNSSTKTIENYTGLETDVVIPYEIDGVKVENIGKQAFNRTDTLDNIIKVDLTSVVIPNSVINIGVQSFHGMGLGKDEAKVSLGSNIKTIGYDSFGGSRIKSIVFPESLEVIGSAAFHNTLIKEVNIPESITTIGVNAFDIGMHLEKVTINNKKENIQLDTKAFGEFNPENIEFLK